MNVPNLHLIIDSGEYDEDEDLGYEFAERRITAYLNYTSMMKMVKAFAPLKGLRKFHLYLALDFVDGIDKDKGRESEDRIERILLEEEKFEKMVMGDDYESNFDGSKYQGSIQHGFGLPFLHPPCLSLTNCRARPGPENN